MNFKNGQTTDSVVVKMRQYLTQRLLITLCLAVLVNLHGCGGSVSEAENTPREDDQIETEEPIPTPPSGPALSGDELDQLPKVEVGARQFADANVLVTLNGIVEAAAGAEIVRTLWVQTGGTPVRIADPTSTRTMIVVPDVVDSAQLEFRLLAEDSEGRVNSAGTSVVVVPQPVFARVIGTVVNEADGVAVFRVVLSSPATEQIVMSYRTVEGTALVESDFWPAEGVLTFEAGDQEMEVSVTLVDDSEPEELETFSLQVSYAVAGSAFSNSGVAVIRNGIEPELDQVIGFVDAGPIIILEGDTYTNTLDETLTPQGQGGIFYISYDATVATVDGNGQVTGLAPGVATIEVRRAADDIYREATAFYLVEVLPSNLLTQTIQFEEAGPLDVLIDGAITNVIVDDPELAPGSGAVSYTSSDETVALVDEASGTVVPVGPGTATITATKAADAEYASATASYELTVSLLPQEIAFISDSLTVSVGLSGSIPLDTSITSPGTGAVTYTSSDPSVATVDEFGLVTGIAGGTATITVTKAADSLYDEASDSYALTVEQGLLPQTVYFVEPDLTLGLGQTRPNPLSTASVLGSGAITYESSDPAVATVDSAGAVTAGSFPGFATITATVEPDLEYEGSSASYEVAVLEGTAPFLEAYIKASNAEANDQFGGSVGNRGMDFDADTLIVGAYFEDSVFQGTLVETDNSVTDAGAAYIFRRDGFGQWIQEAFLKASSTTPSDGFGHDVAVAGNVAVVGAPFALSGQGAVYVFRYDPDAGGWSVPEEIVPPVGVASFGSNVVISDDGSVIAASAPMVDQTPPPAVYVYRFNGDAWNEEGTLTGLNGENGDGFGEALAIEGDTIIVGAPREDSAVSGINSGDGSDNDATDSGAAYVFELVDAAWTQTHYIKHQSNAPGIQMGSDVAIDGNYLAIADSSEINGNGVGYRIYVQGGDGAWTQGTQLIYGESVVMKDDRLVIARVDGEVFINRRNQENLYTSINSIPAQTANFAQTLAISGDIVVVGAPLDSTGATGVSGFIPTDADAPQSGAVQAYCIEVVNGCTPQG